MGLRIGSMRRGVNASGNELWFRSGLFFCIYLAAEESGLRSRIVRISCFYTGCGIALLIIPVLFVESLV